MLTEKMWLLQQLPCRFSNKDETLYPALPPSAQDMERNIASQVYRLKKRLKSVINSPRDLKPMAQL